MSFDNGNKSTSIIARVQISFHHELLPPEIWMNIIECCPKASQRRCLSLSRAFHDRTIPVLFRKIIICFGAWELWVADRRGDEDAKEKPVGELDKTRSMRSYHLLRRIMRDASFATAVKTVEVEAYMRDECESVFENLRPCLSSRIYSFVTLPFHKFKGLQHLGNWTNVAILDPLLDDYQNVNMDEETFPKLRGLHVFFTAPTNMRSALGSFLQRITQLSLQFLRGLKGLEVLLQSLPHVQSLTLHALNEAQAEELFVAFEHGPFNLPSLTQLKICSGDYEDTLTVLLESEVVLLAGVVRGIPALQRFDCSFYIAPANLGILFSAISSLKRLHVLGLHVDMLNPTERCLGEVIRRIPTELDALALSLSGVTLVKPELAELFTRCQHLSHFYLHIEIEDDNEVDVTPLDIAQMGKFLRLVGLLGAFHSVKREDGTLILSERWSYRKITFREIDECSSPEWKWLMGDRTFEF
ncbi:uncharacterized protein C8Q71DRAFT_721653 [Rhodofomes roseus]|uniref:F-box domain-containing protein n=1 Tax=Rhodofomes roseus TaxID=34475 RepID=A0ABQ8KN48_9APHY|nr:uncharacterized protein C8Q71DRAFT_721653 [Rhodofomes roseus]KAH9839834.1 hypothetical protein C8Q71DRAFT_721653 [Rhodofomes roseus]